MSVSVVSTRFSSLAIALVLSGLAVPQAPAAAQNRRLDPGPLLDAYAQGRYDDALGPVGRATRDHARELRQRIALDGIQWVDAAPADRSRRALTAAAFVLEVERIRAERGEWVAEDVNDCAGRCAIEWACSLLQTRGVPDEGERTWMLASIALAQGVRDWGFLQTPLARPAPASASASSRRPTERGHVHHALARFPDDARFRLARAVALASRHAITGERDTPRAASRTAPIEDGPVIRFNGPVGRLVELQGTRSGLLPYLKEELEGLASDPAVGAEARIRLGYLYWVTGGDTEALAAARAAADGTRDPDLQYLAYFLAGQAADALGDQPAAEAHYRAALTARPHSQSATLALATLLYVRGEGRQAYDLVEASRAGRPRDDDPWRMFLYGDFARLPARVAELRRQVAQ